MFHFPRSLVAVAVAATVSLCIIQTAAAEVPKGMPPEERLEKSGRHHEFVELKRTDGDPVRAFVVFPEVNKPVPAVIVIHENRGLNDWARSFADQVAEAGYLAIAPDMLTGKGPDGGDTKAFETSDDARTAIYKLTQEEVTAAVDAAVRYAEKHEAANGKVVVVGFCWGGAQAFHAATNENVDAACVFYGSAPDKEVLEKIQAPVYGFYGGNDFRITGNVPKVAEQMKEADKKFEPVTYKEAGHGFMRSGEEKEPEAANEKGRDEAWQRLLEVLQGV